MSAGGWIAAAAGVGALLGAVLVWARLRLLQGGLEAQAKRILLEAEVARERRLRDAELDAKEAALKLQEEHERLLKSRRDALAEAEKQLRRREAKLDARWQDIEHRERESRERELQLRRAEAELETQQSTARAQLGAVEQELARVAQLSQDDARKELETRLKQQVRASMSGALRRLEEDARREANERATHIVASAIARYAAEHVTASAVSVVDLPSDDMKGRIIGREGRNIRAIEAATGVDIIVDDTPEVVVLSSFNPLRREVAKLALTQLVIDGRIHPARIEEVVQWAKNEVQGQVTRAGEQATFDLGLHGVHPELVELLGKLKFRTSGGQNLWNHSVETATIAGMMASELRLDPVIARRAGLLHDVGKALDHEVTGHHAEAGAAAARRFGEKETVVCAIAQSHHEHPDSVYGVLVQAADVLSRQRPGVRREILDSYIKRLEDLERLSLQFDGVRQAYALQAGRDVRVMVDYGTVSEDEAFLLSQDIAERIETTLTYPGEVRVTVVREARVTEIAK